MDFFEILVFRVSNIHELFVFLLVPKLFRVGMRSATQKFNRSNCPIRSKNHNLSQTSWKNYCFQGAHPLNFSFWKNIFVWFKFKRFIMRNFKLISSIIEIRLCVWSPYGSFRFWAISWHTYNYLVLLPKISSQIFK